jgi:hypothetical protein
MRWRLVSSRLYRYLVWQGAGWVISRLTGGGYGLFDASGPAPDLVGEFAHVRDAAREAERMTTPGG